MLNFKCSESKAPSDTKGKEHSPAVGIELPKGKYQLLLSLLKKALTDAAGP